jgi:hypothetical protein
MIRDSADERLAELSWVGPRFGDGVDAVTVVLRLPAAFEPPRVAPMPEGIDAENFGIVTSSLRRSQDSDELELVRTHVGKGEAVTWRVLVDRSLFRGPDEVTAPPPLRALSTTSLAPASPAPRFWPWAGLAGLVFAALILIESSTARRACAARNAVPRAWLDWHPACRAALGGICLTAAACVAVELSEPRSATALLGVALCAAARRAPERIVALRGPGTWGTLSPTSFRRASPTPLPSAWLDVGRLPGFVTCFAAFAAIAWWASSLFDVSPYRGACALLGSSALLPIFCTGRAAELPRDGVLESRRFLSRVHRRLKRRSDLVL